MHHRMSLRHWPLWRSFCTTRSTSGRTQHRATPTMRRRHAMRIRASTRPRAATLSPIRAMCGCHLPGRPTTQASRSCSRPPGICRLRSRSGRTPASETRAAIAGVGAHLGAPKCLSGVQAGGSLAGRSPPGSRRSHGLDVRRRGQHRADDDAGADRGVTLRRSGFAPRLLTPSCAPSFLATAARRDNRDGFICCCSDPPDVLMAAMLVTSICARRPSAAGVSVSSARKGGRKICGLWVFFGTIRLVFSAALNNEIQTDCLEVHPSSETRNGRLDSLDLVAEEGFEPPTHGL
jgi:hypothetical protein